MAETPDEKPVVLTVRAADRRFGDEEIGRILQRAADLQEQSPVVERARGLTLEELRQVAREAGIDARFVEMAAAEATFPVHSEGGRFFGAPVKFRQTARVDGEISDRTREEIVVALRHQMGMQGALDDVYGRMEWFGNDGMGLLGVSVTSRDGSTDVDVSFNRGSEPGLYFGLGVPFGGLMSGLILTKLLGAPAMASIPLIGLSAVGWYGAMRALWKVRSRQWEQRAAEVVGTILEIVRRQALPRVSESAPEADDATEPSA